MVTTYTKRLRLHFDKELPTEREFSDFVDHYTVAMKKDSGDNVFSVLKALLEVILLTP